MLGTCHTQGELALWCLACLLRAAELQRREHVNSSGGSGSDASSGAQASALRLHYGRASLHFAAIEIFVTGLTTLSLQEQSKGSLPVLIHRGAREQ